MANFFITELDIIEINLFVYEDNGQNVYLSNPEDVPFEITPETIKFVFRKPNYDDSRAILSSSLISKNNSAPEIDPAKFQDVCFKKLIKSWSLNDKNGNFLAIDEETIGKLDPEIVRAVTTVLITKIRL